MVSVFVISKGVGYGNGYSLFYDTELPKLKFLKVKFYFLYCAYYPQTTVAAFLTISPMSVSVVSPDPAMFSCTVDGVPRPNITWLRVNNGTETEVLENSFVHINITTLTNGSTSVLTFSETQPSMSGVYVCLARNMSASAGEMRSNATLTVYGK